MADTEIDLKRLFITEAAFLAGSKNRQFGFDKVQKKLMVHNDVDDTLAGEFSDDSLQMIKARAETVTGLKTYSAKNVFNAGIELGVEQEIHLPGIGVDAYLKWVTGNLYLDLDAGDIHIKTGSGSVVITADGGNMMEFAGYQINVQSDRKVNFAASSSLRATMNIPEGSVPSSPSDGDIWVDGGDIKFQKSGVTKTLAYV